MMPKNLYPYEWAKKEKEKNVIEIPGKANNPRIVWYHGHTILKATDDETAWCSAFICAAAEVSGYRSTRSAAAKSWETYGIPVDPKDAKIGDIVILKRSSASNPNARHVTFLDASYKVGDKNIQGLGGNQGNRVSTQKFLASDIVAIRRFPA